MNQLNRENGRAEMVPAKTYSRLRTDGQKKLPWRWSFVLKFRGGDEYGVGRRSIASSYTNGEEGYGCRGILPHNPRQSLSRAPSFR
jgi:hypothetical protein